MASRRWPQVFPDFLGKYPGDVLWSLMVVFGLGAILRKASSFRLGLGALGFAYGIEALKLCQTPWLVTVRQTTLGHLVLGQVFSWQNLVAYTLGIIAGLVVEVFILPNPRTFSNHPGDYKA